MVAGWFGRLGGEGFGFESAIRESIARSNPN